MTPFKRPDYLEINKARLDHLASLGLPLYGKSVLEVGAGIGMLTSFFDAYHCKVLSVDGRPENVQAIRGNAKLFDLNTGDYTTLGHYGVAFCYGVLYHTENPVHVLRGLAGLCNMLLLETICWKVDDGLNHSVDDNSSLADQSLNGYGCHPARNFLWDVLSDSFRHVYAPLTQPNHPQFPLSWPVPASDNYARAVFVASNSRLELSTLTNKLPMEYKVING